MEKASDKKAPIEQPLIVAEVQEFLKNGILPTVEKLNPFNSDKKFEIKEEPSSNVQQKPNTLEKKEIEKIETKEEVEEVAPVDLSSIEVQKKGKEVFLTGAGLFLQGLTTPRLLSQCTMHSRHCQCWLAKKSSKLHKGLKQNSTKTAM